MPPISDDEFNGGRPSPDLVKKAVAFLKAHKGKAYTATEIVHDVDPEVSGLVLGVIAGFLQVGLGIEAIAGRVEARLIANPTIPEWFYRAK